MSKTALLTGITGQDGSFLAEFLLEKGYDVHGIIRRSSSFNTGRIEHLYLDEWVRDMKNKRLLTLHYGDMTDSSSLVRIIQKVQPDEIYNLAAQSHVKVSFDCPEYTAEADAVGTLRPYGVNTHRLLVRGHRVDNDNTDATRVTADAMRFEPVIVAPLVAAPILFILLIYVLISTSRWNKRRTAKRSKSDIRRSIGKIASKDSRKNDSKNDTEDTE